MTAINAAETSSATSKHELATLGGGCFWCLEALFKLVDGVESVISGYSGGHVDNPTYKQVCSGTTGHAEVVQITFDSEVVSFEELLDFFWIAHDPTTLNRQGNDIGTQYRSVIYYHDERQKELALRSIETVNKGNVYPNPIVTELKPLPKFYAAEEYHQDYFANNPNQSYCAYVIRPKVDKIKKLRESRKD